jgi:glycosyltransferase involved in cell wall biosynthesis
VLRIVYTPDAFRQRVGGVSRYFDALHRGLISRGHRSRILAGLNSNAFIKDAPGVVGVWSPAFRGRSILNRKLCDTWVRARQPAAIIHHTWYDSYHFFRTRQPVAITVHDLIFAKFGHLFAKDVARHTVEAQRSWCKRADIVFAVSRTTAQDVCHYLEVDPSKVVVTPLGVDHVECRRDGDSHVRRSHQLLYVGERSGYKNWDLLPRALQALPDYTLVNVGGRLPTADELAALEQSRILDRVSFVDADDQRLRELFDESFAVVVTAQYEGFGLPALEACRRGCLVISSGTGAQREVLGDAAAYFDPDQADSLVAAIGEAAAREDELRQLGIRRADLYRWGRTVALSEAAYSAL